MPMNRAGVGRLAIMPVNDSRIAQISGKMLIASKSSIVGRMNSQATARSDSPLTRPATAVGVRKATPSAMPLALFVTVMTLPAYGPIESPRRLATPGTGFGLKAGPTLTRSGRILAFLFEDLDPVLDQRVERLLRRALVGDDIVVDAVL